MPRREPLNVEQLMTDACRAGDVLRRQADVWRSTDPTKYVQVSASIAAQSLRALATLLIHAGRHRDADDVLAQASAVYQRYADGYDENEPRAEVTDD